MELTLSFKQTVVERIRCDPDFAEALLDEAVMPFSNGEPRVALFLRDLLKAA
jgi:hypothetical protein